MSTTITGVVKNGVVVPTTPLPEGTRVEIHLMDGETQKPHPLLNFRSFLNPNDPAEQEFMAELARMRREDLERVLREDDQECSSSSSTPTT